MDIKFKKPPNLNHLCMVFNNAAPVRPPRKTFLLTRSNIKSFLSLQTFFGKFVLFNGKLALHPGKSKTHANILKIIDPRKENGSGVIGALITYRNCRALSGFKYYITLSMGSSFGLPGREEMQKVAEHIISIIKEVEPGIDFDFYATTKDGMCEALLMF